jgi:hypothetical protein
MNVYDLKIPRTPYETFAFYFMVIYTVIILSIMIYPLISLCNSESELMPQQFLFFYPYLSDIFKRKIMKSHAKLLENLQNLEEDDEFIVGKKGGLYKQSKYELNFDKIRKLYKEENLVPDDLGKEVLPQNIDFAEIIDLMANRAKVKEIKGTEDLRFLRLQNDRQEEENNRKKIVEKAKKERAKAIEQAQLAQGGKNKGDAEESEIKKHLEKQLYRQKMRIKVAQSRVDVINKKDVTGLKKLYKNPFFNGIGPV